MHNFEKHRKKAGWYVLKPPPHDRTVTKKQINKKNDEKVEKYRLNHLKIQENLEKQGKNRKIHGKKQQQR